LTAKIQDLHANNILELGFCHGDFHGWNAHFEKNGKVNFFDFDCCGHGWRIYDVATFFWGARIREKHQHRCRHFLRGYAEVRQLSVESLAAIPYFIAARHIWLVGLHAAISGYRGSGGLDNSYLDRQLKLLREMDTECFAKTVQEIYPLYPEVDHPNHA
jgi:Ser/Thr protein kinase RdoA (MazF antagonist)